MSNALAVITGDIYSAKKEFEERLSDKSIKFEREAGFAIQVLQQNDYALGLATKNRQSVIDAVTNVAAIGISLNPAKKQAYLVPRDGKICLDISYIGMVELAVASGSVRWVKAELVREQDKFSLQGYDKPPAHDYSPFSKDRGEIVGVYCVAKTADGDYLTDTMSIDEVNAIRDRSTAWKAWVEKKKKCPWVTDPGEMIKKTIVKRSSKMWPKTERLDEAIRHLNTEGEEGLHDLAPKKTESANAPVFDLAAWIEKAQAAKSPEELQATWKQGAEAADKAQALDDQKKLKAVVINALNKLRAVDAEVKERA
jgi:recombination protein RecT